MTLSALDLLELPAGRQFDVAYAARMVGMTRQEVWRNLMRGWSKPRPKGRPPELPLGLAEELYRPYHPRDDDDGG